ncbi:MAG TPA: DNA polymerase III subunit delta [Aeromicrobium sp.]|nr:DNA polymerase III subunit delta [Aeromicrobium sp.]
MSAFGRILLITGSGPGGEFLADRTRARAVAAVLAGEPECEITTSAAGSMGVGEFLGLTSASLFSASTALVLTDLQDIPDGPADEVVAYALEPSPDVALILLHAGGPKGKKVLDQLRAAPAVTEVKVEAPKYERDFVGWVRGEGREVGAPFDEAAATLLVQAVGQDLRALAGAVDQLAATREGDESISVETVRKYFGGRADVRGYEIADAAIDGRFDVALERTRWAESAKVAAPIIVSALASGLRSLAKLADVKAGMSDADIARLVGAPPFKIRSLRQQLRGWDAVGLAEALRAVAAADLDIKSGEADPAYAVERLVLQIAQARKA